MSSPSRGVLDALIAEATDHCEDDSQCVAEFYLKLDVNLALPFQTCVLGVDVTAMEVDLVEGDQIVVICARGQWHQRIGVLDLPLPTPAPKGAEWIEAYRQWLS